VLRITQVSQEGGRLTIKLEGEILAPWVGTVREACSTGGRPELLRLDLAAVTYADAAGTQLLRDLMREGIEIAACSGFLTELLHLDDEARGRARHLAAPGDGPSSVRPEEAAGASASRAALPQAHVFLSSFFPHPGGFHVCSQSDGEVVW
jgi:hypothetical protein